MRCFEEEASPTFRAKISETEPLIFSIMRDLQTQILCVSMLFYFALNGPWDSDPGEELRMSTHIALDGPVCLAEEGNSM